jgi:hypothetical protein
MKNWMNRAVAVIALVAVSVGVVMVGGPAGPSVVAQSPGLGAGGEYHPLTPTRIHDSRVPGLDAAPTGKKSTSAGGSAYSIPVLGRGGVPSTASDVLAVVVGVVIAEPGLGGHMALYPAGSAAGTSSLVNFSAGRNVPNLAIVGVGDAGKVTIDITTAGGNSKAHVIVDVFGWFSTSSSADRGARLHVTDPDRIFDSRKTSSRMGTAQSRSVKVRGTPKVPNDPSITGVVLNVTVVNERPGSTDTYISVTPDAVAAGKRPTTSNVNVVRGQIKATMAILPIGADGNVHAYNYAGETDVVLDVLGYMKEGAGADTRAGRVVPLTAPFRVFDTRLAAFGNVPLGPGRAENWSFEKFADSVTLNGSPVGEQSGLIGNLTGTGLQRYHPTVPASTYMSLYPGASSRPNTSNLNLVENENVPNLSLLKYGTVDANTSDNVPPDTNVVQAFNYGGYLHYLLDVSAVVLK